LIYETAHALDDLDRVLMLVTNAYLKGEEIHLVFPLEEIVQWAKEHTGVNESALNRSITLDSFLKKVSPKYDGDLSDAFEDVLDFYEVEKPSQLLTQLPESEIESARWRYFFREIATIRRLEDSTRLNDYEESETERLEILTGMIQRCPELANALSVEVVELTRDREVAKLAAQFDRSRIYVNETGIKQFVEVELRDAVTRYRRLLDTPQLESQVLGIEEILLKILKASGEEFVAIKLPATAQEGLLYAIYTLVADSFVLNPDHGFKT
jgi:hypothetical protein